MLLQYIASTWVANRPGTLGLVFAEFNLAIFPRLANLKPPNFPLYGR